MKAVNTVVSNEKREKRAKSIAAMGLVKREGDRFLVTTPSLKGQAKTYEVDKNHRGSVRCTCPEFAEEIKADRGFRCEHILAVKFQLTSKAVPPVASEPVDTEAGATQIGATEPLKPESDEQGTEKVNDVVEAHGQASMKIHAPDPLANTKGEVEMKQETLMQPEPEVAGIETDSEESSNVLDFSSTLKELRRNVDPRLVKQREGWRDRNGRVQMVDYVEWHTVADILDETAPNWSHTIKDIRPVGDFMTVTAAITIDGVTREGVGTGLANSEMGIKKAEHDALKRAAVKFGIARDLYKKESDVIEREGGSFTDDNGGGFPSNPMAANLSDQVTAKQLGMIKAIARETGIDADEECRSLLQCTSDELSKRAASQFIKHLQDIQRRAEPPSQVPFRRAS
jgi:predicted nucleic acid-binding Zn finger protein